MADDLSTGSLANRWAVLVQAKMSASGGGKTLTAAGDLAQLDLLSRGPLFSLPTGFAPGLRDFSTCLHPGAVIDGAIRSHRAGDGGLAPTGARNLELVTRFAAASLPGLRPMRPDASFLVWIDARPVDDRGGDVKAFFLNEAKVNLYSGRVYGPGGEGFIRLNIGCPRAFSAERFEPHGRGVGEGMGRFTGRGGRESPRI